MATKRKFDKADSGECSVAKRVKCNYCFKERPLTNGKSYCTVCARDAIECVKCHRPLPQRLMRDDDVCKACKNKSDRHQIGLGGEATTVEISLPAEVRNDALSALGEAKEETAEELKRKLEEFNAIKWYLTMIVKLTKFDKEGEEIELEASFQSTVEIALNEEDVKEQYDRGVDIIERKIKEFVSQGSGWSVGEVVKLDLHVAPYEPLRAASYIPTDPWLTAKKAIINVKNDDEKCFVWSVLAGLHPQKLHANRVSKYVPYMKELNVKDLTFPLKVTDVKKFEKKNPSLSVNVFALENKTVYPVHLTINGDATCHVNLLVITSGDKWHYTLIKNMSALLSCQTSINRHKKHWCYYCLHGFMTKERLNRHVEDCNKNGLQKVVLPDEKHQWIEFDAVEKMLPMPFVIYADFESFLTPMQGPADRSSNVPYEMHVPSGFCNYVVCRMEKFKFKPVIYRGPNVIEKFLKRMKKVYSRIYRILRKVVPIKMKREEEEAFKHAKDCYLCDKPLSTDRVRDHCHLTGTYRGACHNSCNLSLREKKSKNIYIVPVVFHNLRGYDGHFIIRGVRTGHEVSCIPNNMEKYVSFSINNLRFIDSYQFMAESLEKLVSNLHIDDFIHTKRHSPADKLSLLLRKGVYPYEYVDGPDRFEEEALPPMENFYNRLTDQPINIEDYNHARNVWTEFDIKTLGEYHDLYLKTDVLLLADVFEKFRKVCTSYYKLDPAHYYTSPGLAWDAMLKMTKVKLELMRQREMHDIVEKGIRGGMCCISHKYAKANNPYIQEDYDPSEPTSYILYLDMNNLYGTAMSEPLPRCDFKLLSKDEASSLDFMSIPDDAPTGYIFEVDLDYPWELHDSHNSYPLCPENTTVNPEQLSSYSTSLAEKLGYTPVSSRKLVANLNGKYRYSVHYRNLKLYVRLGMKVISIHRAISFTQSAWLKTYIDFNTEKRKESKNDFEKNFFKLLNNSVFGKTIENMRKRQKVDLITNRRQFRNLVTKPNFQSFKIFTDDLVAVHMKHTKIKLYKPTYAGMTVLDISKLLMFQFHYVYILPKYGNRVKLLMTDTDSLIYHIATDDVYKDIASDLNLFDTSDYSTDHLCYSTSNKKKLGKMKDEYNGTPIKEFVGLRPKMYSILDANNKEKKTAKGISQVVTKRKLRHDMYRETLFEEERSTVTMNLIRASKHVVTTNKVRKVGLSPFDDKRYVLDDKVTTLAHWHYAIDFLKTESSMTM